MYKAKNGFTLKDDTTPEGWIIKTPEDIITALLSFPEFDTVETAILWEALEDATGQRQEYDNIKDLADYLANYYI